MVGRRFPDFVEHSEIGRGNRLREGEEDRGILSERYFRI
jgi:hypothetical protein